MNDITTKNCIFNIIFLYDFIIYHAIIKLFSISRYYLYVVQLKTNAIVRFLEFVMGMLLPCEICGDVK